MNEAQTKLTPVTVSTPSAGSTTPEQWWAKRASELAAQMKAGGVAELRITRLPTGKYDFEITPEEWSNAELSEPGGPAASESTERVAPPGFAPVIGSGAVSRPKKR